MNPKNFTYIFEITEQQPMTRRNHCLAYLGKMLTRGGTTKGFLIGQTQVFRRTAFQPDGAWAEAYPLNWTEHLPKGCVVLGTIPLQWPFKWKDWQHGFNVGHPQTKGKIRPLEWWPSLEWRLTELFIRPAKSVSFTSFPIPLIGWMAWRQHWGLICRWSMLPARTTTTWHSRSFVLAVTVDVILFIWKLFVAYENPNRKSYLWRAVGAGLGFPNSSCIHQGTAINLVVSDAGVFQRT